MRAGLETGHSFRDLTTGCGLKADPGYWGGGEEHPPSCARGHSRREARWWVRLNGRGEVPKQEDIRHSRGPPTQIRTQPPDPPSSKERNKIRDGASGF